MAPKNSKSTKPVAAEGGTGESADRTAPVSAPIQAASLTATTIAVEAIDASQLAGVAIAPNLVSLNTPESDQNGEAGNSAGLADLGEQLGEEAFRAKYPLTTAALDKLSVLGKSSWTLRVKSKQAGFRRGGIAHPEAATDHALAEMHPDQVEAILGEPMLDAELL